MRNNKSYLIELKARRQISMIDGQPHGSRVYRFQHRILTLCRCVVEEYHCYRILDDQGDGKTDRLLRMDGDEYWGDNLPWKKAESMLRTKLDAIGIQREK